MYCPQDISITFATESTGYVGSLWQETLIVTYDGTVDQLNLFTDFAQLKLIGFPAGMYIDVDDSKVKWRSESTYSRTLDIYAETLQGKTASFSFILNIVSNAGPGLTNPAPTQSQLQCGIDDDVPST